LSGIGAWQAAAGCPNSAGIQRVQTLATSTITTVMTDFLSGNALQEKAVSDQSFWPFLVGATNGRATTVENPTVTAAWIKHYGPARLAPYADLVRAQCGEVVLSESWWANICAGPCGPGPGALAIESHTFLILRKGHWLVWASQ
jgi:hypothetical protein